MSLVSCGDHQPPPHDFPQQNQPPPEAHNLQEITGTVAGYKANREGDIDKLRLQTKSGEMLLRFPPHTAKQVLRLAVKYSTVHVQFDNERRPPGQAGDERYYDLVSLRADNNSGALGIHDIPPPEPMAGSDIVVTGSTVQWQPGEDGTNTNFILSGKLVTLPPHASESIGALLNNAHSIVVKGVARNAADGFINSSGLILVKPHSIIIDSIHYIIP